MPSAAVWSVVAIVAAVVVVGALAWWLSRDSSRSPLTAVPSPTTSGTAEPSANPDILTTVTTTRVVLIDGDTLTVEERSEVSGGNTEATPVTSTPLGLELVGLATLGSDGRTATFDGPVTLAPSGSLTVRSRYRVTDCPDLLPPAWPTPVDFVGSTRAYVRVDEPLHTAAALCPGVRSRARSLTGLTGTVVAADAEVPTVRLRWEGPGTLEVASVGSASGVAALPVELGCGGSCVAELTPGGTASLTLQPIDPCPPATDDDTLTLQRAGGELVAVTVDGLHRAVCEN
jgi:hypothetical protein